MCPRFSIPNNKQDSKKVIVLTSTAKRTKPDTNKYTIKSLKKDLGESCGGVGAVYAINPTTTLQTNAPVPTISPRAN